MFTNLSLFSKGLIAAGLGLAGTFLVLILVFITIKLFQKIGAPKS